MKRIISLTILFLFLVIGSWFMVSNVHADELEDIEKKLSDLKRAMQMSVAATTPLEKNLDKLEAQLNEIRRKTTLTEKAIDTKEKEVKEGEKLLILAQDLLSSKVREIYKSSTQFGTAALSFLFQQNLAESLRRFGYQRAVLNNNRDAIVKVVFYIKDLEQKKKDLESEKIRLAAIKAETDKQAAFLTKEISGAKKYQSELSRKIAELTTKQQQLLAAKFSSLGLPTSLGAGPLYCTDDRKIDPGFSPAFAFFTYGIPHRIGMNQYGAYGRARDGQSHEDILRSYFDNISFEKKDPKMKIKVQGYPDMELDEYMLGIYEMPGDWPIEALKAQAVAARSYALAYTNSGEKEICTTQTCQVYKGGNKGGNWEKAVRETEGKVMTSGGTVISAWYSSTDGGYTYFSSDVGWSHRSWTKRMRDTKGDVNSFSDLEIKAYDRDSPCFYAAQGARSGYGKSAWLKVSEVADIVNILMLAKKDSSVQNHLSQADKPNPDGVDTWDAEKVRQELRNRGTTPYNNITSVFVDWDKGLGKTTTVNVSGDAGSSNFEGNEFKNFFNLRAPANIQIVGPLYNIEKR